MSNTITTTPLRQYFNDNLNGRIIDRRNDTIVFYIVESPTELQEDLSSCNLTVFFKYYDSTVLTPFNVTSIGGDLNIVEQVINKLTARHTIETETWDTLPNHPCSIEYEVKLHTNEGNEMYIHKGSFKIV